MVKKKDNTSWDVTPLPERHKGQLPPKTVAQHIEESKWDKPIVPFGLQIQKPQSDNLISNIEQQILSSEYYEQNNNPLFLAKGITPYERILRYAKDSKTGFKYLCAKYDFLNFEADSVQVTLLPDERAKLVEMAHEMFKHGLKTGRFSNVDETRTLADITKGNTGEFAGIKLFNSVFNEFGLDTRLKINTLKLDGRGDGGRDAVIGLYNLDFKYRNDIQRHTDLVVSSYKSSNQHLLIHTHSIRRSDDLDYTDTYYLHPEDSAHIVIVRGGVLGSYFSEYCSIFKNGRYVLDNSKQHLVPIWDLALFLAIQAAKQEGFIY